MKRRTSTLAIMIALLLLASSTPHFVPTQASSQEQGRVVIKKPWRLEPLRVMSVKTKKKGKIEIGKPFVEDDDWLDGFTITVFNGSNKVVTAVVISMIFPRPAGDTRNKYAQEIYFGPSPISPAYTRRDPRKLIKPGETAELEVRPYIYQSVKAALQRLGFPESINRIELTVLEVGFEDGSVLLSGTLYHQDPDNPSDPTKKVPSRNPNVRGTRSHHRIRHLVMTASSKKSLVAPTLNSSGRGQEACWEPAYNPPSHCPPNGIPPPFGETNPDCYVTSHRLSSEYYGTYDFELMDRDLPPIDGRGIREL